MRRDSFLVKENKRESLKIAIFRDAQKSRDGENTEAMVVEFIETTA